MMGTIDRRPGQAGSGLCKVVMEPGRAPGNTVLVDRPVYLGGTFEALPMNSFNIRPRPLELVVGDQISAAGYAPREMDKLAALAEVAVGDLYYSRSALQRPAVPPPDEALRHAQLTESPESS